MSREKVHSMTQGVHSSGEKRPEKRFKAEIIHLTLDLKKAFDSLHDEIYGINITKAIQKYPYLPESNPDHWNYHDRSAAQSIYPLGMMLVKLDDLAIRLDNIVKDRAALLESTRNRRELFRTGNLKKWIDDKLPKDSLDSLTLLLSSRYKEIGGALKRIKQQEEGYMGWMNNAPIVDGKIRTLDGLGVSSSFPNPIIRAYTVSSKLEKSAMQQEHSGEALPKILKDNRQKALQRFSVFAHKAEELIAQDPYHRCEEYLNGTR
ncbi:hypothetical protein [Legionella quateirensis]|uniref:Uncharacterized protein n=1 Tax=Legionella quateirensis TaxID=45072 RepID=A0A378KUU2_9GAMM|nr:hypothetical protein [Legionella quateirensis]KTD43237.1 hypothetical protein Lqua_3138 [Legionella quateirensis]STY18116.1 Uncharacterised protein [Legionella quateirensis]